MPDVHLEQDIIVIIQDHVLRHVTGHVGSGNMRIDEFTAAQDDSMPYDVVEDLSIFMRNDPMFYRKRMFPCIMKMKDAFDGQKSVVPQKVLGPVVDEAMDTYCEKFNLGRRDKIFKIEDRDECINKVYGEEMKQIESGAY